MDIVLVLGVVAAAMVLFMTERYPMDLVAILILGALALLRLLEPEQLVEGFSHPATVTVACMFVLSAGLQRTGAIRAIGNGLIRLGRHHLILMALIMLSVGTVSAFINNTAAVAVFIPLVLAAARARKTAASRLLIPLSYASQFGGVCTLIGTSTNLLVSGISAQYGHGAFSMFEMGQFGVILFATGTLYFLVFGHWLLPRRPGPELHEVYHLRDYLTELVVKEGSPLIGRSVREPGLPDRHDVTVVEILREGRKIWFPLYEPVQAGDTLLVRGKVDRILELQSRAKVEPAARFKLSPEELQGKDRKLVEAIVPAGSNCIGRTIRELQFRQRYSSIVLGVQRHGALLGEKLADVRLELGDAVLMFGRSVELERLQASGELLLLAEVEQDPVKRGRAGWALGIVGLVVGLAALEVLPILVTALLGCSAMVLSRCLTMEEAYRAVDWRVIFLLAGVLALGVALDQTGAAALISRQALGLVGPWGMLGALGAIYLLTALLTECMSNNASAALMAPIALGVAAQFGVDPKPLLMAVAFAASTSFATPVGYQTNLMVFNAGNYRFTDFLKVGLPLNVIFAVLAIYFIPLFWPM